MSLTVVAAFVAGYLLGRMETILAAVRGQSSNVPQGFFAKTVAPRPPRPQIEIDERKVVTEIRTDTLSKTQDIQLGKQVVQADNLEASASKLAQLKRS
jgi:hypothetical protein